MLRPSGWLLPLAALWLVSLPAAASVTKAMPLPELVAESEHVVLGTVVRQEARRDHLQRIVTDVTIRVEESMKGGKRAGEEIVVRRLGGVLGELGMRVEGEPSFVDGERAILFAAHIGAHLRPVGMSQGVLRVRIDAGGRELAMPGGAGLSLVREVNGRVVPAAAALTAPRPLGDLLDEIRSLASER